MTIQRYKKLFVKYTGSFDKDNPDQKFSITFVIFCINAKLN